MSAGHILTCKVINECREWDCTQYADIHRDKDDIRKTLRDAVGFLEDARISIEEDEEHRPDDAEIDTDCDDNRFRAKDEWSRQRMGDTVPEGDFRQFRRCSVSVVRSDVPQLLGFPCLDDGRMSLRKEQRSHDENQTAHDECGPVNPSPMPGIEVRAQHWTKHWSTLKQKSALHSALRNSNLQIR